MAYIHKCLHIYAHLQHSQAQNESFDREFKNAKQRIYYLFLFIFIFGTADGRQAKTSHLCAKQRNTNKYANCENDARISDSHNKARMCIAELRASTFLPI